MFNNLTQHSIIKRSVILTLTGLLLSFCQTVWAKECRMNDGKGGTTTLVNPEYTGGAVRLPQPISYTTMVTNSSFNVNLTPGVQAVCTPGQNGDSLMSQTNPQLLKGSFGGNALFETNIPGIYYTVNVRTAEGGNSTGGFFSTNTTGWVNLTGGMPTENWDGKWIRTSVYFVIGPEFQGNPKKETVIKPKAGTLGKMSIGEQWDSDNQPYTFMVTEDSFQIPIILPTCDIAMLSDGTDTVNLGDYFVSDIKNNNVKDVPFSIHLNSCTSTTKFTTKLTTTKLTGTGNDLLGNTLTSGAEGAGVRIIYNGSSQLIPNNANSSYIMTDTTVPGSTQINYVAQLVANGSTVKPGAFKATGVFTLSYD